MSKILVTGATGQLGKAVVNELLQKISAADISVLVRDLAKAEDFKTKGISIIKGDYADYASLLAAFKDIDKLYFVSSSDIVNRVPQHENVVKAAVEAKVGHIVYTGAHLKTEDSNSPIALVAEAHWKTADWIKQSGLTYTILKHGLYTDALPWFMGDKVIETGTIFLPAGDGKASAVTRADLATAGAIVLTTPGHENKVYNLVGDVSYSFYDIAAILSDLSKKNIQYVPASADDFTKQLKGYGLPEEAIQITTSFCVAIAQGEFQFTGNDTTNILGRKPQSVQDFLKGAYGLEN